MDFRDPASIPLPTTDDDFERLCLLIARDRYGPEFYRYGRGGQAQHGIDIYSAYYNGRCLQCKLHKKGISDKKLIAELKSDLRKAKKKFNDLKQFIFAISVETSPVIQGACKDLSDDKIKVIPWFWNQMQEDIARSKWLLRYCLNYTAGEQWVIDDFLEQEQIKGDNLGWQPLHYYSSNNNVQWYGLLEKWDAPRQHYADICQAIVNSFADTYSDMPVAVVVRGDGGSGKSVLLRRLSIDFRHKYTVYWIADNAEDFLTNEWIYDIDKNPTEKYLLVLEDWYRNFASTSDRTTANRLLQKIKSKTNVRLVIGDRPTQYTYYPKNDRIIFDLKSEENNVLLSYVINIIPEWKDIFTEEQRKQLLKTGLFQLLFVYQYAEILKPLPKARNYFLEIIQSDYRHLFNSENPFYKGLVHALYVYAQLYTDIALRLSPEALIILAETYSGTQRPFELKQNSLAIVDAPVVKRYLDIVSQKYEIGDVFHLRFLHDTLADEGWKYVQVDSHKTFGSSASILEIAEALKTEKTNNDLSELLYWVLKSKSVFLMTEQILSFCDYLIDSRCELAYYVNILFKDDLLEISDDVRINYLNRLVGLGNNLDSIWDLITIWITKRLSKTEQLILFRRLVDAGNTCSSVLVNYYLYLDKSELRQKINSTFTVKTLLNTYHHKMASVILKRLGTENEILSVLRDYLQLPESEKIFQNFTACLKLLKDEEVAKDAARKYLLSPEPEKISQNFITCLKLLKDEEVAKDTARKYLLSPEPEKISQNFITCLKLLKDEEVAKDAARKYLLSPEPEKISENFSTCLEVLGEAAADIAARILESPIDGQSHGTIYRALTIATETEKLDIAAKVMVNRIVAFNNADRTQFHLYMQLMRVPLFRMKPWQEEVDKLLQNGFNIYRNLFYSLTLSHINKPEPLGETCLFFIRNWKQEFKQPKKYWGYFIRSLAHPIIEAQHTLQKEIQSLCQQMLLANNCPSDLKPWLKSITEEDKFPEWKRADDDGG